MTSKWFKRILWIVGIAAAIVLLRYTVLAPKPLPVSVYRAKKGKVEETVTNSKAGTVKVRQRSSLSPEIGGRVIYIGSREGDRVKANTLLMRLDDSAYRASLNLSRRAVQSADGTMQEACIAADLAERDFQRNSKLHEQGIVSVETLDQIKNRLEVARARCASAKSEVKRSEAGVEMAQADLKKTELRAPFDGIIVQLSTEVGEWVTPSPPGVPIPPVMDILNDASIYVEAPMDETDSGRLKKGLPVRISLDPYPEKNFTGKLTRVGSFVQDIEGQNRTVDVEAEFVDHDFARGLLAGTSADIEVILDSRDSVLRIPSYAIQEGNKVLVVDRDKLVSRTVKTGLRNWEYVEIREGLVEGDAVVVTLDRAEIKEGARVKIAEEIGR